MFIQSRTTKIIAGTLCAVAADVGLIQSGVVAFILLGAASVFFFWSAFGNKKASTVAVVPAVSDLDDDIRLDMTTKRLNDESGWDYWDLLPPQKQLKRDSCHGGPPNVYEVYEYAVRSTSVFVRLTERSAEGLYETVNTVFGGVILRSRIEEEYRKKCKPYHPGGEWEKSSSMLSCIATPAETIADLEKETNWHEIYGAVRYFVLSRDPFDWETRRFLKDEYLRFSDAYTALETKTTELGITWDDENMRYDISKGATPETRDEINKAITAEIFRLGFRSYGEVLDKDLILGVLKETTAIAFWNAGEARMSNA